MAETEDAKHYYCDEGTDEDPTPVHRCDQNKDTDTPEQTIRTGGEDLSIFEIMQRFRNDGSCEYVIQDALIAMARVDPPAAPTECFCGTELEAGICPNGHDPITAPPNALVDEVQHRMDQVVDAAVEWHQAGREGGEWFDAAEKLGAAIDSLLELRVSMPRRWCSIHNREEFKYEALEHELYSAPPAPDEADKVLVQEMIENAFGKRGQSPIYQTAGRLIEELQSKFTAALAQARSETWEAAARLARAMATGETFETGRQKALNIAAALESAAKQER